MPGLFVSISFSETQLLHTLAFQTAVVTAMTSAEECIHWLYFEPLFVWILA
jgi:hypothetical protein